MTRFEEEDCGAALPIQEKKAWIGLFATALVYGVFLADVLATPASDLGIGRFIILFTVAITIQSVLLAIGHSILVAREPEAAKAPLDERDLLVARRATTAAYGTLMAVVFLLGLGLPYFAAAPWQITLGAIMAMVIADLVRQAAIIINYHRNG